MKRNKGHLFKIDEFKHTHTHRYAPYVRWQIVEKRNSLYALNSVLTAERLCKLCWWFVKPLCPLLSVCV